MSGYDKLAEQGWPLGAFVSGEVENIPVGALGRLYDGFLDEQGVAVRRGGSVYKSNAAFGTSGLRWLWDGILTGGQRTLFVDSGGDDVGMLAADDATPVNVLTPADVLDPMVWAQVGGVIYIGITGGFMAFAGARKTGTYSTGTVTVTEDSPTVTGVGTSWLANVDAGMLFAATASSGVYAVKSVDSDTQLHLDRPWGQATAAGAAYTLKAVEQPGVALADVGTPSALAGVANRLAVAAGRKVYFSPENDPLAVAADWLTGENYHEFPGNVLGLAALRDTLIVFTTAGTFAIYNMALNLTDASGSPQQRVEQISDELVLWGRAGGSSWQDALIVPAVDGVYLLNTTGRPVKVSGAFEDVYLGHVRAGYQPGGAAVFNGRYFLPILNSSNVPQDLLSCRLTPNSAGRSNLWAQHRGHGGGGGIRALAVRVPTASVAPLLLAAGEDGKVSTLRHFEPQAAYKDDADGVDHQLEIQTRAFPTGGNVVNTVRFVTVYYTLTDAATDNPTIDLAYAIDGASAFTAATGSGAESTGVVAKKMFVLNRDARVIQFRIRTNNAAATAKIRGIELQVHRSGRA